MNKTMSLFDGAHRRSFKGSKKSVLWRDGYLPKALSAYLMEL